MKKKIFTIIIVIFSNYFFVSACDLRTTDSLFCTNINFLNKFINNYIPNNKVIIFLETLKSCDIFNANIKYDYAVKITLTHKDIKTIKNWYKKNRRRLNYAKICKIYKIWNGLIEYDKSKLNLFIEEESYQNLLLDELEQEEKKPTLTDGNFSP